MSGLPEQFNIGTGGNNRRSCYVSDRVPLSYHRQPGSPTEGNSPTNGGAFNLDTFNASNELDLALLATGTMDVDIDHAFLHASSSSVDYGAHSRVTGPTGSLSLSQVESRSTL